MTIDLELIEHLPDLSDNWRGKHKAVEVAEWRPNDYADKAYGEFMLIYVSGRATINGEDHLIVGPFRYPDRTISGEFPEPISHYSDYRVLAKLVGQP